MVPAVAFEMLDAGLPKFTVFRRLKTSTRKSTRRLSANGNRLVRDKSTRLNDGPMSVLRPAVPWKPAAGTVYAVGSNHLAIVGLSILPLSPSRPGAKLAR